LVFFFVFVALIGVVFLCTQTALCTHTISRSLALPHKMKSFKRADCALCCLRLKNKK